MSTIQNMTKSEYEKSLAIFLGAVLIASLGIIYYIWTTSSAQVEEIIGLQRLSDKAALVLAEHEQLIKEQDRLQALFEKEKDFNIKVFFEQFYKQLSIMPEPGWKGDSNDIGEKFTETILQASFKNLSMQQVTQIIDTLDKKETIYFKEVTIRSEPNKQVTLELKLGTVRPKKGLS